MISGPPVSDKERATYAAAMAAGVFAIGVAVGNWWGGKPSISTGLVQPAAASCATRAEPGKVPAIEEIRAR